MLTKIPRSSWTAAVYRRNRLRYLNGYTASVVVLFWLVAGFVLYGSPSLRVEKRPWILGKGAVTSSLPRVSCFGPRGRLLSDSVDDELEYGNLEGTSYPVPFLGSHRALGVEQSWITADGRYGPYGRGEDEAWYNRTRVDWDRVDWAQLQNDCFQRNRHRFPKAVETSGHFVNESRLAWKNQTTWTAAADDTTVSKRTALVLRSWASYDYQPEDLWHIRSLIVEASLRTGGDYFVILFVHIQDKGQNIFSSQESYDAAFKAANIPPELQSIAVLWDDNLLESWYDQIDEHTTFFQVYQPLQLLASQYPEFSHFWQLEMDQRFLGDSGKYLDAVSDFARSEPRKQALERSTFTYSDEVYESYQDFIERVDEANDGQSRAWDAVKIKEIQPIGPRPPVSDPRDDDFSWGVGEEADTIVSSFCAYIPDVEGWLFKDWLRGKFARGFDTPRWYCPPAVMRGSRNLLLKIHEAQRDDGLAVPGEATLPSWTLWHGLKLSYPPHPVYMRPHEAHFQDFGDDWTRDPTQWLPSTTTPWFGNVPEDSPDGLSHADPNRFADRGLSFWWNSEYPRNIMNAWLHGYVEPGTSMPGILAFHNGQVYAPNAMVHPVKH